MYKICAIIGLLFLSTNGMADSIRLYLENDIVAKTDSDYTHGTRITYGKSYTNDVPFLLGETKEIDFSLTQLIYTPSPKSVVELQPLERPYAGFLGIGVNTKSLLNKRTQFEEGIAIGVVGPYSFAEETQTTVHEWLDSAQPMGWDNQLNNEPIINYHYAASYKAIQYTCFDIISKSEAALGNMFTYIDSGFMTRVGYNLNNNFGLNRIEPTTRVFNKDDTYFYLFVYPQIRYVVQNIFLDGNTFEDSHSVEKEPIVTDFSLGAAAGYDRFELAFSYVFRSKEFETQTDADRLGAITVTYNF